MDSSQPASPTKSYRSNQLSLQQSLGLSVNPHITTAHKIHQAIFKNPQSRKNKQIQLIVQFIKDNEILNELIENIDFQFAKNLVLKHAQAIVVEPGKVLVEEGQKIQNFYVLVQGHLGRLKGKEELINKEVVYQNLTSSANSYMKDLKKQKNKITLSHLRKMSISFPKSSIVPNSKKMYRTYRGDKKEHEMDKIQHIGIYDRSVGNTFLNTVVTHTQTLLLKIPQNQFLMYLDQVFKNKIKELENQVKVIPCFSIPILQQEKQKFATLIMSLTLKKKKRGDYIYQQNDFSTSIFLLKKGNVKLTKQTNLFVQNPNNLYTNRVKLMIEGPDEGEKRKSPQKYQILQNQKNIQNAILPYADLRNLYNYRPKKKNIEIGILSPFCLFGEEEHLEKKRRQTNAVCNSLQVAYYQISIKRIEQIIGTKYLASFLQQMKQSSKNKVLYRQSQYANTINFENKNNLDYFYYEGEREKESSRKFRITKFNKILEPQKGYESSRLPHKFQTPAFYTTFNFNKMQKNPEEQNANRLNESDEFLNTKPTDSELKIMDMTHTWKIMERKVIMEENKSKKISPQKHTIDINKPLIENNFFRKMEREKKRIEKEERTQRLSLGSTKSLKKSKI